MSIGFFSCRKDFSAETASVSLKFSADTVYLDTVFTNISSSTRVLKVYNQENKWISIPEVRLGRGDNSQYRINIDGASGTLQENVEIAPKDSIFIFIESTIDYSSLSDPLYTDSIIFSSNTFEQDVKLVSLVQDAHFIFPQKGESIVVIEDGLWTAEKPYVIYGYAVVDSSKTLTIEAGSKIHFHNNSGLIVYKDASLKVNGELNNEVVFEGDRLEPLYSDIPGQWGMIWLYPTSKDNYINYANIKNGSIALRVDSVGNSSNPTLEIKNTKIFNHSIAGILAQNSHIEGENLVTNNIGQVALALEIGGKYSFKHSTFANYYGGIRNTPSVLISNWYQSSNGDIISRDLEEAFFGNCIIYGNNEDELLLLGSNDAAFNYKFENNLIRYTNRNGEMPFVIEGNPKFESTIISEDPLFWDPFNNDLRIEKESPAASKGKLSIANDVPLDILNLPRNIEGMVDIGAYQSAEKEEEEKL